MFSPLKHEEVQKIHRLSLEVLENTGIRVASRRALGILLEGGARAVSEDGRNTVCIPPAMVERALRVVPRSYTIHGRREDCRARFERGNPPLFGPSGVPYLIYDHATGTRREATLGDFVSFVKLLDGLPNVDLVTTPCTFTDIPREQQELATFFHLVNTTCKPFSLDFSGEAGFRQILSLVEVLKETVFNGKTFVQFFFTPVRSPLQLDRMGTDQLIEAVRAGIPVAPISMAQTGVSAPATLAGTLIVMNAEILALIVLSQTARPGAPFLYGTIPGTTNFQNAELLTATPELPLLNAAATQMAEWYGLPNWATAGRTDSKILDIQAGYEQAFSTPCVALAGATYISAIGGFLQSVCALSFEKFVIDDEIVGTIKRVVAGIDADDDHCALELISSVGPGGSYLSQQHTIKHMRREFFSVSISDQSYWDSWVENGKATALEKAQQRAQDIIADHATPPLPEDAIRRIKDALPDVSWI
jgi:trimethylamine--corrinoid protein Co-methyltransferase